MDTVDPDAETQPPEDIETQEPSCYEVFGTYGQHIEGSSEEEYILLSSSPDQEPEADVPGSNEEKPGDIQAVEISGSPDLFCEEELQSAAPDTSLSSSELTFSEFSELPVLSFGATQLPFTEPQLTTQDLGLQHELTFSSQTQQALPEEIQVPQSPEPYRKKLKLSPDLCKCTQTFMSGEIKHFHLYTQTDLVENIVEGLENTKSCQTISLGHESDINISATVSKYHRVLQNDKSKRGGARESYRAEIFSVPVSTEPSAGSSKVHVPQEPKANLTLTEKVSEKQQTIGKLRQEVKQLKRKLERRDSTIGSLKEEKAKCQKVESALHVEKRKATNLQILLDKKKQLYKRSSMANKSAQYSLFNVKKKLKTADVHVGALRDMKTRLDDLEKDKSELNKNIKTLNTENAKLQQSNDYLQNLLNDEPEVKVYNDDSNAYSNDLVECAINLTDLKVSTKHVGAVIQEVGKLCGKTFNSLPTRQTVDNFVDRKVSISQKQIGTVLKKAKDTTLYTDETRKYGHTYESYILTDDSENSYLLGLREMVNKSGACTLDTLKSILTDISDHCKHLQTEKRLGVGYELLTNIRNTMSDRASTEKHFNVLLQEYRNTILPEIIDNYENLSEDEKQLCGQMNNFFCGLHLLVGMADVTEAAVKQFEKNVLDGKLIGSAKNPELKRYHRAESGCLRLLRTSSKSFAMGEDEKNGVYLPWKTYLKEKDEKNYILRFKHNRFNMIFLIGQAVYYHRENIYDFLNNVHGATNDLLKAVLLDCQEHLYLAGAKALGLISKFVTAPLWRLLESPGHILDMNKHFQALVAFSDKAGSVSEATVKFMVGDNTPFEEVVDKNDKVLKNLLAECNEIDEICLPLLQGIFVSVSQLLRRMIPEHLPGGTFWEPSETLRQQTSSALKHNKLPEFIFGQLDHLVSYRPNASVLANEAYIMYSFNKTARWLEQLPLEERSKIIEDSRKEGREIREKFKCRLKEIEAKRLEEQKKKKEERKRLEMVRVQKAENLTQSVCYYGLWQSSQQIDEGIAALSGNEKEIIKAIQSQLKFRKDVLKQRHDDKNVFKFSLKMPTGKYRKLSINELKANLLQLVRSAIERPTEERPHAEMPLLVGKTVDHVFTDKTYRGKVISIVPGFPEWYNIIYDGDEAVYAYNLSSDYEKGDLRIIIE